MTTLTPARLLAAIGFVALGLGSVAASAQVVYQPYAPPAAPTPYGYPVASGFLQPNEVLGTSPSFFVSTNPYAPGVAVIPRCQYPDGWNMTDLSRDMNGIPAGIEHTCHVAYVPPPARVRAARSRAHE